ncbi:MAG: BMP family ABC transporter substrate-binding protein [Desulfurococcaceae archaeon TW002]
MSSIPKPTMLLVGLIIAIIVVGVLGYYIGSMTVPVQTLTITTTKTETVTPVYTPPERIKAGFIYVGPIGDFGWTFMHDLGRKIVAELYKDWLETTYYENVPEAAVADKLRELIRAGYNVFFTTSFGFMEGTRDVAREYPNLIFWHCSGYLREKNMGTYFADFYQIYYLNGLAAGALTKTGKVGYVAAFLIPEVVRHLSAFAIGAREVAQQRGLNLTLYVIEIGAWYNPIAARSAAETLVNQYGVDVIAFTEDSTAIVEYAEEQYRLGKEIYVFSHYSPMYVYGPNVVVSGQLVRWEVIYADILGKIKAGIYTPTNLINVDYWYLLNTGAVEMAAHVFPDGSIMYINPKFEAPLKGVMVTDKMSGKTMNVYDLIWLRYEQMRNAPMLMSFQQVATSHIYENVTSITITIGGTPVTYPIAPVFDPFMGPLSGYKIDKPTERVTVAPGARLGHADLWAMDWVPDFVRIVGRAGTT